VSKALREAEEALARINRAMSSGVLDAAIAYELSQPLCAIVASAFACSRWLSAEPPNFNRAQRALERIAAEGRRASNIIDRIGGLAPHEAPRGDRFDLNEAFLKSLRSTQDDLQSPAAPGGSPAIL